MEKKMGTTIMGYIGLGFRNGKEDGNYYSGLYRDYDKGPFLPEPYKP